MRRLCSVSLRVFWPTGAESPSATDRQGFAWTMGFSALRRVGRLSVRAMSNYGLIPNKVDVLYY